MRHRLTAILVLGVLVLPEFAAAQGAQVHPTGSLRSGLQISIVDEDGRRIDGRVVDVSDDAVSLRVRRSIERIPFDRVVRIDKTDTLKNGALTGLVAGVGLGLAVSLPAGEVDGRWVASVVISNGLIWSALGAGIDALVDGRRTLYQRAGHVQAGISPVVGPGVRGAAMRISW